MRSRRGFLCTFWYDFGFWWNCSFYASFPIERMPLSSLSFFFSFFFWTERSAEIAKEYGLAVILRSKARLELLSAVMPNQTYIVCPHLSLLYDTDLKLKMGKRPRKSCLDHADEKDMMIYAHVMSQHFLLCCHICATLRAFSSRWDHLPQISTALGEITISIWRTCGKANLLGPQRNQLKRDEF